MDIHGEIDLELFEPSIIYSGIIYSGIFRRWDFIVFFNYFFSSFGMVLN